MKAQADVRSVLLAVFGEIPRWGEAEQERHKAEIPFSDLQRQFQPRDPFGKKHV